MNGIVFFVFMSEVVWSLKIDVIGFGDDGLRGWGSRDLFIRDFSV